MFSIPSFSKLFLLIAVIAAVWYGFRFIGEIDRARRQALKRARQGSQKGAGTQARSDVAKVEETLKCKVCGAYVPARQPSRCARSDCPF